jgi:hypothetical protein
MGIHPFQMKPWARVGLLFSITLMLSPGILNCADSGAERLLEPGPWGGHGAALTVVENRATVEFDCAMGYIRQPIFLQPDGRFSVPGEFVRDTGGPVRLSDPEPRGSPAIFSGEVSDSRLLLQVDMPDEGRTLGPFTLTRSQTASLDKCL